MKKQGSISVFMALIIICILSLIFVLLESARSAGARWHLQNIASSAHDSLFSEYQIDIWKKYRLSFLEYIDDKEISDSLKKYSLPYMKDQYWYGLSLPEYRIEDKKFIYSEGAYYLEKEILDFMKYEIFDFTYLGDSVELLSSKFKNSAAIKNIGNSYGKKTKEAQSVENKLESLVDEISKAKQIYEAAGKDIEKGDFEGFISKAEKIEISIKKSDSLFENYNKAEYKLTEEIKSVNENHGKDWEILDSESYTALKNETDNYNSYTIASKKRKDKLTDIMSSLNADSEQIENAIDLANDLAREDEENIDLSELKEAWENVKLSNLEEGYGIADKQKENSLKELAKLLDYNLFGLVLPKDVSLSAGEISIKELPSQNLVSSRKNQDINFADKLLVSEYIGRYFNNILDKSDKEFKYEMEYILAGQKRDIDNLKESVMRIIGMREGLNILHILADKTKMAQAKELALAITGVLCLPELAFLMEFLIIGIWALAEAVLDVKALLAGGKVVLYKAKSDWQLDIEALMNFSDFIDKKNKDKPGLDYETYIKILIYMEDWQKEKYRMLDIIQKNLSYIGRDIEIRNLLYGIKTGVYSDSRRLFNNIIRIDDDDLEKNFKIKQLIIKTY